MTIQPMLSDRDVPTQVYEAVYTRAFGAIKVTLNIEDRYPLEPVAPDRVKYKHFVTAYLFGRPTASTVFRCKYNMNEDFDWFMADLGFCRRVLMHSQLGD